MHTPVGKCFLLSGIFSDFRPFIPNPFWLDCLRFAREPMAEWLKAEHTAAVITITSAPKTGNSGVVIN